MRRLPSRPEPHALLGNAFHDWVERFYGTERLFDLADLPGAADTDIAQRDAEELATLQKTFLASPWAARTPVDVEVPFEMPFGDTVVRGRIDAVFAEPDGGATVVDWKTGEPPHGSEAARHAAIQLGVYRLAWAALSGCRESLVRTAFHYVRTRLTVVPDALPGPTELAALLADQTGKAGGVAAHLEGRGDHRNLQRQPGQRDDAHRPRLVPPQPAHVDVARQHRDEQRGRR